MQNITLVDMPSRRLNNIIVITQKTPADRWMAAVINGDVCETETVQELCKDIALRPFISAPKVRLFDLLRGRRDDSACVILRK